jgi:hypothetical protein
MKFKETSQQTARLDMTDIVKLLIAHAQTTRPQQEQGSPGIRMVLRELAQSEKYQGRGELLTPIMALPPRWRPLLMEYINHEGPWSSSIPLDCYITLRNNDTKPHRNVIYDSWWEPGINIETGEEELDNGFMRYEKTTVEPGETIELTPHWAALIMRKYCKRACNIAYWSRWEMSIGVRDCWEEIGYRISLPRLSKELPPIKVKVEPKKAKTKAKTKTKVEGELPTMGASL